MLKGHLNYYAVSGNSPSLWWYFNEVRWRWLKSLKRRSQRAFMSWEKFTSKPLTRDGSPAVRARGRTFATTQPRTCSPPFGSDRRRTGLVANIVNPSRLTQTGHSEAFTGLLK